MSLRVACERALDRRLELGARRVGLGLRTLGLAGEGQMRRVVVVGVGGNLLGPLLAGVWFWLSLR